DNRTLTYVHAHSKKQYAVFTPDEDAEYENEIEINMSELKPMVAFPHLPENAKPIDEIGEIPIDQVVIGSCTNGRMEDLRTAAAILKGTEGVRVAKGVRLIILPGTQSIYLQALKEGLIEDLVLAGAAVSTPTCGPCLGGHMGVLAEGERCVATTNRNFVGRMGHVRSEVYLAGPAVAAVSAIKGRICKAEDLM
ncbi:MAG: aconitase family protein, partial [Defluviitaleaceae bacterium]|nr:aconitase family protein [Defluviitaleaceae bacterium]